MIAIYETDSNRVYTGLCQVNPQDRVPVGSTLTPPPETTGTQVAQLQGSTWVILPEYPQAPGKSPVQIKQEITDATQARLDAWARERNYDGILSLCTYAFDPDPKFQAEGQLGVDARSATWAALYSVLAEVEAGTRPMPESFADVESLLPALNWN